MRYRIEITRKALKQAMKIQERDRVRIFAGIRNLEDSETWGDVRKLVNHEYDYRLGSEITGYCSTQPPI